MTNNNINNEEGISTKIYENATNTVYRYLQILQQTSIIIKSIKPYTPKLSEIKKLINEYELVSENQLVSSINPIKFKSDNAQKLIIYEDFNGVLLKDFIAVTSNDLKIFLNVALSLTAALEEFNKKQIIQHKINPYNILINPETLNIKFINFDASVKFNSQKLIDIYSTYNEEELNYLSPELLNHSTYIDYRSDFFSLGITLYEMLTNKLPYNAITSLTLLKNSEIKSPYELNCLIPKSISDIIMKLIFLELSERYKGYVGIKTDLQKCYSNLLNEGKINYFFIGNEDPSPILIFPNHIFGRENESKIISEFVNANFNGLSNNLLISGYSGVGKTTIVEKLCKPDIENKGGLFISGKFQNEKITTPYFALKEIVIDLISKINQEKNLEKKEWRTKLFKNIDDLNRSLILEIIPELKEFSEIIKTKEKIINPDEKQNRLNFALITLIKNLASPVSPVFIFFDDLHWADQASLRLLLDICTDRPISYLAIIGAYRVEEVFSSPYLKDFHKLAQQINIIELSPLEYTEIEDLIQHTFSFNKKINESIAKIIFKKSAGNPFFAKQIIKTFYNNNIIFYNYEENHWYINYEEILKENVSENVVDILLREINYLSPETIETLKYAATLGYYFDLKMLAIICKKNILQVITLLWSAIEQDIIISLDKTNYLTIEIPNISDPDFNKSYKFSHDKIHSLFYSLIPEKHSNQLHLQIGKELFSSLTTTEDLDKHLFIIINNINKGKDLVKNSLEKLDYLKLNFQAGVMSITTNLYETAEEYFNNALFFLEENFWDEDQKTCLNLYIEYAQAQFLLGNFKKAEDVFTFITLKIDKDRDKIKLIEKQIILYILKGQYEKSIKEGMNALKILGMKLPYTVSELRILYEVTKINLQLNKFNQIEDILLQDDITDEKIISIIDLISHLAVPTYKCNQNLMVLGGLKIFSLSVKYGNTVNSAFAYLSYGILITAVFNQYKLGYRFAKIALNLLKKYHNPSIECKILFSFSILILHWNKSLDKSIESLQKSFDLCLKTGNIHFAGLCVWNSSVLHFFNGNNLNQTLKIVNTNLDFAEQKNISDIQLVLKILQNNLLAFLDEKKLIDIENVAIVEELIAVNDGNILANYYIHAMETNYILGHYQKAFELGLESKKYVKYVRGIFIETVHYLFFSLSIIAVYDTLPILKKIKYRIILIRYLNKFKIWAKNSPYNHMYAYYFISAEFAKLRKKSLKSISVLYDKAINIAQKRKFIQRQALILEKHADLLIKHNHQNKAKIKLTDSFFYYSEWGAIAKLNQIKQAYQHIIKEDPAFEIEK